MASVKISKMLITKANKDATYLKLPTLAPLLDRFSWSEKANQVKC